MKAVQEKGFGLRNSRDMELKMSPRIHHFLQRKEAASPSPTENGRETDKT